jgi:hypothetical protein
MWDNFHMSLLRTVTLERGAEPLGLSIGDVEGAHVVVDVAVDSVSAKAGIKTGK